MRKRMLFPLLALLLLLAACAQEYRTEAERQPNVEQTPEVETPEEDLEPEEDSVEIERYYAEKMHAQRFAAEANDRLMESYFALGVGITYPDYFSGVYIGDDNVLHILVHQISASEQAELEALLEGLEDWYSIEPADYSYNELYAAMDAAVKELLAWGVRSMRCYVDMVENYIQITIDTADAYTAFANGQIFKMLGNYPVQFAVEPRSA